MSARGFKQLFYAESVIIFNSISTESTLMSTSCQPLSYYAYTHVFTDWCQNPWQQDGYGQPNF